MDKLIRKINDEEKFSDGEKLRLAQAFEAGSGTPLAQAWTILLKQSIKTECWQATHLPEYTVEATAKVAGKVAMLEQLLVTVDRYKELGASSGENK